MNDELRHFFDLLIEMTEKELRARYKYTVLGFLWIVLNPILQMLVIGFIFTFFIKEPIEHYYFYLFTGLLIWNFFSLSLTKATPSIVFERGLIKKTKFPHMIIPLSIIFSNLVHMVLAFLLFFIPIIFLGTISASRLPFLFLGFFLLVCFVVGMSLLTSALNVRFRDVSFFTQALLIIWFYATPVIYSLAQIPRNILWLWYFNPMTSILQLFQHALLNLPAPSPAMIVTNTIVIAVVSLLGIAIFHQESKYFDDWI